MGYCILGEGGWRQKGQIHHLEKDSEERGAGYRMQISVPAAEETSVFIYPMCTRHFHIHTSTCMLGCPAIDEPTSQNFC